MNTALRELAEDAERRAGEGGGLGDGDLVHLFLFHLFKEEGAGPAGETD